MFDVAEMVGDKLREVIERDGKYVEPYGDPSASFLVGGEIAGEGPRLFEIYSAGNFVEASPRSCFLQIGETKYGKPILDRGLTLDSPLDHAAKLALLSFDATMRSNLSVGLPIDLLRYEAGSLRANNLITLEEHDAYWRTLRDDYGAGLTALVDSLPAPAEPADEPRRAAMRPDLLRPSRYTAFAICIALLAAVGDLRRRAYAWHPLAWAAVGVFAALCLVGVHDVAAAPALDPAQLPGDRPRPLDGRAGPARDPPIPGRGGRGGGAVLAQPALAGLPARQGRARRAAVRHADGHLSRRLRVRRPLDDARPRRPTRPVSASPSATTSAPGPTRRRCSTSRR